MRISILLGVLALVPALAVPATTIANAADEESISTDLWMAYGAAIEDAAVSRPGEVVNDLLVPTRSDPRTQWATFDDEQYMLVQALKYRAISQTDPGTSFTIDSDTWITVPGELDEACAEYDCWAMSAAELDLVLKQVIGLPPDEIGRAHG